jgi:hypothetical protein
MEYESLYSLISDTSQRREEIHVACREFTIVVKIKPELHHNESEIGIRGMPRIMPRMAMADVKHDVKVGIIVQSPYVSPTVLMNKIF